MRRLALWAVIVLASCPGNSQNDQGTGATHEATWLRGFGYSWENFNHRLSYLQVDVAADAGHVAVIGGASTTEYVFDDDDSCVGDACQEFPFFDPSNLEVAWARVSNEDVWFQRAQVSLTAGAAGASTTATVELPEGEDDGLVAVISGIRLDTGERLDAQAEAISCYDTRHGWNPRVISVRLGTPTASGTTVEVPVEATFEAGLTLEEARVCLDSIVTYARVGFTIDVVVMRGDISHEAVDVSQASSYAFDGNSFNPPEQPPLTDAEKAATYAASATTAGWTALRWDFSTENPDQAPYLRTLMFHADVDNGLGYGHATNYSPISQTSGMDVTFAGTIAALELDGVTGGVEVLSNVPTHLDDEGRAVITELKLAP